MQLYKYMANSTIILDDSTLHLNHKSSLKYLINNTQGRISHHRLGGVTRVTCHVSRAVSGHVSRVTCLVVPWLLLLDVGHVLVVGAGAGRLLDVGGGVLVLDVDRARVAHADRVARLHITAVL